MNEQAQNIIYEEVGTNMCAKSNYTGGGHKKNWGLQTVILPSSDLLELTWP